MPLSGYEEQGVNPHAWHSSDSVAGVPIKKRRFLLVRPPSPPPETPSSPQLESHKEQFIAKPVSSSSNAGGFMEVSGFAGISTERSVPEKGEEHSAGRSVNLVQNSVDYSDLNRNDKTLPKVFGSEVDSKCMLFTGNTELQLASYGHLVPGIGETVIKKELNTSDKSELSRIPGKSEMLLIPKESLNLGSAGENSEAARKEQEKLDPYKWNLGLPKGQDCSNSNDLESEINATQRANRSHWDLNTMMETWAGSLNDAVIAPRTGGVGVLDAAGTRDIKPAIGSRVMVVSELEGTHVGLGKEILHKSEHCSKPTPVDQQYRSDDLRLGLSPSVPQSGSSQELSCLSREVDSRRLPSNQSLPEVLVSPSKLVDHRIVKSEPSDEGSSVDFVTKVGPPKLVEHGIVKSEPLQGCSEEPHKLSNVCHMKSVDRRAVKPEPVQGGSEEKPKKVEKMSIQSGIHTLNFGVPTSSGGPNCDMGVPVTNEVSQSFEFPTTKLSNNGKVSDHSLAPTMAKMPTCGEVGQGVKPEPVQGGSEEKPKRVEKMSIQSGFHSHNSGVPTSSGGPTCGMGLPVTNEVSQPFEFPTTELSNIGKVSDHSLVPTMVEIRNCGEVGQGVNNSDGIVSSGLVSQFVSPDGKEQNADDMLDLPRKECLDAANPDQSQLDLVEEPHVDALRNGEVSQSDEKVNISADEEFPYDTDYESDGNHVMGDVRDTEDKPHCDEDDYEDGEVREPSVHSATEDGLYAEGEAEHVDDMSIPVSAFPSDDPDTTSDIQDRDPEMEETKNADCTEQHENLDRKDDQGHNEVAVQESSPVELQTSEIEKKKLIKAVQPLEHTDSDHKKGNIVALASDVVIRASKGLVTSDGKDDAASLQEVVHRTNSVGASSSVLSKTEPCVNGEETAKDVNGRGNRSRIINLPRASNVSSSAAGTRQIQGRVLPSQSQGERFSDVVHRGDKLHARGSREGRYMDSKFERKRSRDQPFGSTGSEFRLGRGRADNRLRSIRGEWDSSVHDFSSEQCNGPTGFRFPRSKNPASAKVECSDFVVARGGRTIGTGRGRGGRKSLDDELPNFRHPPSRRRSPGGREGPVSRGVQIVHRAPRDISPDRCITEDDPDLIGLRHEEKFMRGLPGEVMTTVFSRSQPQYERLDDSFVRGDRSFSPMQRRVPLHIPQVHSKSPPRSRTRSPGPWSSPRRRSPDGFVGHPELTHCRSPRIYRMERMRSPHQHPCFAEEMVVRRHDSPPYMPRICNDMREMGSSREHDHPRSFIRSRSPSGRILPRSTRRFEMVDPRERTESDELFAEAMHSGRFHELVGDGADDGRRKCIERRGPVRSFRPPYNGSDVVNYRHHEEDGPRPYRFCPEVDAEFHERGNLRGRGFERGNLRGRGFDRRMKNRPDNAPRTRSIEEQEENYWHNEQGWHEADFEDVSHMKRRRF
ncbi:hypothetical protein BVC80_1835g665 [Macleaya cordata]|uniref:Uncharacterized protein n=1 Tax=Macleaya cordata TaxID=56857 RepID=A0A200R6C0_MACCD|nr:hypothetical protein BVC80_1835g665 [Macleaya cordata]